MDLILFSKTVFTTLLPHPPLSSDCQLAPTKISTVECKESKASHTGLASSLLLQSQHGALGRRSHSRDIGSFPEVSTTGGIATGSAPHAAMSRSTAAILFTSNLSRTIQDSATSLIFYSAPASETRQRTGDSSAFRPCSQSPPARPGQRRTRGIPPLRMGSPSHNQTPLCITHLIKSAWFFRRSSFSSLAASPRRTNRLPPLSPPALATSSDVRCFFFSSSALSRSILCVPRLGKLSQLSLVIYQPSKELLSRPTVGIDFSVHRCLSSAVGAPIYPLVCSVVRGTP